jgi:tetratricopeptide (TPR) repeat protein
MALAGNGQKTDAIVEFQEAIRLKSDYAVAYDRLGSALEDVGRIDDAIAQFQEAVRLRPDYAEAGSHLTHALQLKTGHSNP